MVVMCKVCLTSNVRIYTIEHSHLEELYEKLTCDSKGDPSLGVLTVCYICFSQLKRCHILSALAKESKRWLKNLYNRDIEVSQEIIMKLNTGRNNFSITNLPSLSIKNNVDKENESVSIKEEIIEHDNDTVIEDEDENTQINLQEVYESQSISLEAAREESVTEDNTPDKQPETHKNKQVYKQTKVNVKKEFKEEDSIPVKHDDAQIEDSETSAPFITPVKVENIIDDNIYKITSILQELKVIIEEATPALLANYKCQIQHFKELRNKGGGKLRLPKKRFSWCLRSLGLLARLKVLAGSEEAGVQLLRERVLPLFPKGFARMPTLLKMSGYKPQHVSKRRKTSH